jgi:hypothetical protein
MVTETKPYMLEALLTPGTPWQTPFDISGETLTVQGPLESMPSFLREVRVTWRGGNIRRQM